MDTILKALLVERIKAKIKRGGKVYPSIFEAGEAMQEEIKDLTQELASLRYEIMESLFDVEIVNSIRDS